MKVIKEFKGDYAFLSNFYLCRVPYGGRVFPSSEHAFMSMKSLSTTWKDHCELPTKPSYIGDGIGRHYRLKIC
jgi:predicted NAD-dependent protein-ADP-ribosyltransferase YbiA (DUF1768 family)